MSEEIKIDGIPIQDYGTPNSRSCYPGEIQIGETIKNNIDYWRNRYFEEKEKNRECIEALEEWINGKRVSIYCIHKDKIREILQKGYRYSNDLVNELKELVEEK